MKYLTKQQIRVITGTSAEDFQERFNGLMSELSEKRIKPEVQFNMAMGFCAYVTYTENVTIAENLAEEYELKGEVHFCSECPFFNPPEDKRIKNCPCAYKGTYRETGRPMKTSANEKVCDYFYLHHEEKAGDLS